MRSKPNLVSLCGIADDATEADLSGLGMDAADAAVLASELPDKGTLSSLNLAKNMLRAEGVKQLSSAIKGHITLTILDISSNEIGAYSRNNDGRAPWIASPEGPIALADAIKDNGALSKLIFGGDPDPNGRRYEPAILAVGMTEADLSNKNLGVGGAIIISAWLTHKDNGAMTSLNLASNNLEAEGAKIVADAIKVTKCTPAIILEPFFMSI
jgi:hypothetical protein